MMREDNIIIKHEKFTQNMSKKSKNKQQPHNSQLLIGTYSSTFGKFNDELKRNLAYFFDIY